MSKRTDLTVNGQRSSAQSAYESRADPVRALYIHVPFCFHKCHYCDFYSFVDTQDRQAAYLQALEIELRELPKNSGIDRALDTIFIGGGTPSLLRPELWQSLLRVLNSEFDLSRIRAAQGSSTPEAEFTVECNPETVTEELMGVLAQGGVTRVSIGAQSFNLRHLKSLERWHDPENVLRALELAHRAGIARRNIDLIFAIPGQTAAEWRSDLEHALSFRIEGQPAIDHLSAYALTYEPNTPMTARLKRGDFDPCDDELEVEMQLDTVAILAQSGFDRYEVSNFARPGAECLHNLAYWRQSQWLAAGPSASGHVAGWRWKNVPRLTDWMESVNAGAGWSAVVDLEPPDERRAVAERIMTGLRLREGLDPSTIDQALAFCAERRFSQAVERWIRRELLEHEGERLRLTARGYLFADGIAADLMSTIERD